MRRCASPCLTGARSGRPRFGGSRGASCSGGSGPRSARFAACGRFCSIKACAYAVRTCRGEPRFGSALRLRAPGQCSRTELLDATGGPRRGRGFGRRPARDPGRPDAGRPRRTRRQLHVSRFVRATFKGLSSVPGTGSRVPSGRSVRYRTIARRLTFGRGGPDVPRVRRRRGGKA